MLTKKWQSCSRRPLLRSSTRRAAAADVVVGRRNRCGVAATSPPRRLVAAAAACDDDSDVAGTSSTTSTTSSSGWREALAARAAAAAAAAAAATAAAVAPAASAAAAAATATAAAAPSIQHHHHLLLNELALVADGPHWILKVLGIGALNVAGFLAVQALVRGALDTSVPVTLVKVRCALRRPPDGGGLRARLGDMRALAGGAGAEGLWLTLEEAINELNKRRSMVAYAEAGAELFSSQREALDAFRRLAADEAARTAQEEARTADGPPDGCPVDAAPSRRRRGSFGALFGRGNSGPDADGPCAEMVVVTLVVVARGALSVPPLTEGGGWPTLRKALQQLSGLSSSALMGIELLWAPGAPEGYLSAEDVRADYPDLVDLSTGRRVGDDGPAAAAAAASR